MIDKIQLMTKPILKPTDKSSAKKKQYKLVNSSNK